MVNLDDIKKTGILAVREAGGFLKEKFRGTTQIIAYKDRQDVVTNIDLSSEEIIIKIIKKRFPNHGLLAEEKGEVFRKSKYTWVIDPLDGTKEYIRGIPLFNVTASLLCREEILAGFVYWPMIDELYWALKDKGAFLGNQRIKVSLRKELLDAFIDIYLPRFDLSSQNSEKIMKTINLLRTRCYRMRGHGSLLASLCWVANGAFEAVIDGTGTAKPWDFLAGVILVEEAGGKTSNFKGEKLAGSAKGILASNGKVHQLLLKLIEEAEKQ